MTQGEIEEFVRQVVISNSLDQDGIGRTVAEITSRWLEEQADAFQRGCLAGGEAAC